ncbi:MAG TPA: DUF2203 domain-containing protein [Acidimicrobiales bacterium]|nr:DUF2203 domain-containing protein [Acidimicrobiales bacterium]
MIDPDDPPRWWTVEEANAALPRVTAALSRAQTDIGERVEKVSAAATANGHSHPEPHVFPEVVRELEAEGIVLRDVERGLVDFAAQTPNGRGFWLCWVIGEPEVAWWHWPEDGFAGRTPLSEPPG